MSQLSQRKDSFFHGLYFCTQVSILSAVCLATTPSCHIECYTQFFPFALTLRSVSGLVVLSLLKDLKRAGLVLTG